MQDHLCLSVHLRRVPAQPEPRAGRHGRVERPRRDDRLAVLVARHGPAAKVKPQFADRPEDGAAEAREAEGDLDGVRPVGGIATGRDDFDLPVDAARVVLWVEWGVVGQWSVPPSRSGVRPKPTA